MHKSRPKHLLPALAVAAIALCLSPQTAQAEDAALSAAEAVGFGSYDTACTLVQERFFDPAFNGVDWQSLCEENRARAQDLSRDDLAALLNTMLARLQSSHTHVYTPRDPTYYLLFDVFAQSSGLTDAARTRFPGGKVQVDGIGIFTRQIDGQVFIEDIVEGTPAHDAGLLVGDELVAADGVPFHPIDAFAGRNGETVRLDIRRKADGDVASINVMVARLNPSDMFAHGMQTSARIIERDGQRIGYVRIWSSAGETYQPILRDLIEFGPLATADALIVDLRGRIGGGGLSYLEVIDPRGPDLTVTGRGFSQDAPVSFRHRTLWLIDDGVRSSTELLAYTIRQDGYGPLIGTTTAGAVVGGSPFLLPDGNLLYLAVADLKVDGRRLEGIGVVPDIAVPFLLPYAAGSDPQLDRALSEATRFGGPVTDLKTLEPNAIVTDSNLEIHVFNIAGERVSCEGVAQMRCLVVNGEYFYDVIIGYTHVEGRPARICVQEIPGPSEVPADAGTFIYQRVVCGGL